VAGDHVFVPPDDSPPLPTSRRRRIRVTADMIQQALSRMPLRRGTHRDKFTWEFLRDMAFTGDVAEALAELVEVILNGECPPAAARWLRSGTQLGLLKDQGQGIRPAVMGCCLRRLAARVLMRRDRELVRKQVGPRQFGLAQRGTEQMFHLLEIDLCVFPDDVRRQLDIANAHNSFCRRYVRWLFERDEDLVDWVPVLDMLMGDAGLELYYYGGPPQAGGDNGPRRTFLMFWGGHQGCALTGAVFPRLIQHALRNMRGRWVAFQDDVIRMAPAETIIDDTPAVRAALRTCALASTVKTDICLKLTLAG
jgi:hypothetical protein